MQEMEHSERRANHKQHISFPSTEMSSIAPGNKADSNSTHAHTCTVQSSWAFCASSDLPLLLHSLLPVCWSFCVETICRLGCELNSGMADFVVISLKRPTSDKAWGFSLQGGRDKNLPVFVHKITRNGIAHKAGLEPGDVVYKICATDIFNFTHDQTKAEILRAGNDLDFTVRKHEFNIAQYNAARGHGQAKPASSSQQPASPVAMEGNEPRSEIVEEHLWRHGGPTFKNVTPKSYKILEATLPQAEAGAVKIGSIMDREADERSPYLKATEQTIQRAYGESS